MAPDVMSASGASPVCAACCQSDVVCVLGTPGATCAPSSRSISSAATEPAGSSTSASFATVVVGGLAAGSACGLSGPILICSSAWKGWRQIGHLLDWKRSCSAHCEHRHRCRHGSTTVSFGSDMHTTHSRVVSPLSSPPSVVCSMPKISCSRNDTPCATTFCLSTLASAWPDSPGALNVSSVLSVWISSIDDASIPCCRPCAACTSGGIELSRITSGYTPLMWLSWSTCSSSAVYSDRSSACSGGSANVCPRPFGNEKTGRCPSGRAAVYTTLCLALIDSVHATKSCTVHGVSASNAKLTV
eukprot:Unigene4212_Nuclearia_a/m.12811 Unigene4212_Nuclearia_a/g.12811  ORF Unigene4212_Nuclearia_a/g.12811 Unigene4212_Nuclearia_a/m.12811 type:complete len:301 (+) Unigene4212_Nuclearia_a:104-1006(+)